MTPSCAPVVSSSAERQPGEPTAVGDERVDLRFKLKMLALSAVGVILVVIIVLDVMSIERSLAARALPPDGAQASTAAASSQVAQAENAAARASVAEPGRADAAVEPPEAPGDVGPDEPPAVPGPHPPKKTAPSRGQTVEQAYSRGCSTASVDGLSRQIVAEARCMNANAFAAVPARKNLITQGHVFLHLEAPARDKLLHVLDAHPDRKMTVNSAFRTVAQQYLLDRWARSKRCGIKLAARPGESNHETGLALDVSEHAVWRDALEKQGFRWLGPTDVVHFDFQGGGAGHHEGLDIVAFQRLWNRNHPDDRIAETGRYDSPTEARVRKAPAAGFASGPQCGARRASPSQAASHGK
jgi:hypothetical protein